MDRIDIKILGQLHRGVSKLGFQPDGKGLYRRIAKKLALNEDTIRKRVDRLESSGVIRGWQLVVNPDVFGLNTYALWMTVDSQMRIEEAVRKIRLVHGVATIVHGMGDILSIGIVCESAQVFRKRIELISELTGGKELTTSVVPQPKSDCEPTSTDWQIINTLRTDPLMRYTKVGEKLGLSTKTVQRRVTKLTHGNAIFFLPDVDFTHLEGASWVGLSVYYTDGVFKDSIERSIFTKFEDYVLLVAWTDAGHGYLEFVIPNAHALQEIVELTRAQEGVRDVRANINYNRLNFYDDVLDEIATGNVKGTAALWALRV